MDAVAHFFFLLSDTLLGLPAAAEGLCERGRAFAALQYDLAVHEPRRIRPVTNLTPVYCTENPVRVDRFLENIERGREFAQLPPDVKRRRELEFTENVTAEHLRHIRRLAGMPETFTPAPARARPVTPPWARRSPRGGGDDGDVGSGASSASTNAAAKAEPSVVPPSASP